MEVTDSVQMDVTNSIQSDSKSRWEEKQNSEFSREKYREQLDSFLAAAAAPAQIYMKPNVKRYLEDIYYDPSHPGSYSGVDKLYRAVRAEGKHKISRKKLDEFLKTHETYGVHRKAINQFPRPRVITSGVGIQAEADLADMSALALFNDQFKFVLVHIDIFSKYVRPVPLKSKMVTSAFKKISADGGKTQKIRTDRQGEFVNKTVQALFWKEGIKYFTSSNITK